MVVLDFLDLRWATVSAQEAFLQKYAKEQVESAIAYGMQSDFREELQPLRKTWNLLNYA